MKKLFRIIGRSILLFIKRRFITKKMLQSGESGKLDDEVTSILVFAHGVVCCFNRYGHQVPKYQGPLAGVAKDSKYNVDLDALRARFPKAKIHDQRNDISDYASWQPRGYDTRIF